MRWRRKRTSPSATELSRVEKVLEVDPTVRHRLEPMGTLVRKRSGEPLYFSAETVAVVQAVMDRRFSPERAHVRTILRVAGEVLGMVNKSSATGI
jgi:hypothetical protein